MRRNPSTTEIRAALLDSAPTSLQKWAKGTRQNRKFMAILRSLSADIGVRMKEDAASATEMSLEEAKEWIEQANRQMLDATVFEAGRMAKDVTGFSVSTYGAFKNFLAAIDELGGADIGLYMAAVANLRHHAKTQLGYDDWKAAYEAVKQAYEAERKVDAPAEGSHPKVFNWRSGKGLDGVTDYEVSQKGGPRLYTGFKRGKPNAVSVIAGGWSGERKALPLCEGRE